MRRKIQRPEMNARNPTRCDKRSAAECRSSDRIETAIDKMDEIASDSEAGPPLPPRPPISRQRFSLSMETGENVERFKTINKIFHENLKIETNV